MLSNEDWDLLKNYIIALAPDTLDFSNSSNKSTELTQFKSKQIKLDNIAGSYITYLKYEPKIERLIIGNVSGNLMSYDFELENISFLRECGSGVTDHTEIKDIKYTTAVGRLDPDPSEIATGKIFIQKNGVDSFISKLHRPVNTLVKDLNNDGNDELIISEFGNLHGKLSLYSMDNTKNYKGKILLDQPGAIRTLSRDMDNDGRDDLISLVAQGDENITIFFNQGDLNFKTDKVLQFSPVYGSSWFDLIDYDGDGDEDIITVNGDNADFSYVQKPYHGLRIHINDGNNHFTEKYFYPMNGATRFVANDFDQDGDVDFGIISTFPDYEKRPEFSFVYLENTDSDSFIFDPFTMNDINSGRWLLLDSGDIDQDGDEDIILSSFTYVFSPVPKELLKLWKSNGVDLLVLENNLIN